MRIIQQRINMQDTHMHNSLKTMPMAITLDTSMPAIFVVSTFSGMNYTSMQRVEVFFFFPNALL